MYWRRLCNPLFLWLIAAFFLARITNDVFPLNEAFGLLVVSCPGCILRRENTRRWERPFNGELLLLFKHFRRSTSLVFRCKILSVFLWVCAFRVLPPPLHAGNYCKYSQLRRNCAWELRQSKISFIFPSKHYPFRQKPTLIRGLNMRN